MKKTLLALLLVLSLCLPYFVACDMNSFIGAPSVEDNDEDKQSNKDKEKETKDKDKDKEKETKDKDKTELESDEKTEPVDESVDVSEKLPAESETKSEETSNRGETAEKETDKQTEISTDKETETLTEPESETETETNTESETECEHNIVEHDAKAPTCTETGWDAYVTCSKCDYTTYSSLTALGHTPGDAATCTEAQVCVICDVILETALGHEEVLHVAKIPTCTEYGREQYTACEACSYTTYKENHALGHDIINNICSRCQRNPSVGLSYTSNGDGTCYVSGIGSCSDIDIVIPEYSSDGEQVIGIGRSAFRYNSEIQSVTMCDSITYIEAYAFQACRNLTDVFLSENIECISECVFSDCMKLVNVEIPENVRLKTIEYATFQLCKSLKNIVIPESVKEIGDYAFSNCQSLTYIYIPKNVSSIGTSAFGNCYSVERIEASTNNSTYHSSNNCLIETASGTLVVGCKNSIIPKSVKTIGDNAFRGCINLVSLVIPDNVTSIGGAFVDCTGLTDVILGSKVETIANAAFSYCQNLTNLTISSSVSFIGNYAFYNCKGLTTVYYTDSAEEWALIYIGSNNEPLTNATIIYNYVPEE